MPTPHVLIIGAGRIGQTLASLIRAGSSAAVVSLWDKNTALVPNQLPLAELVPAASLIFCCTPSWTVRDVLTDIQPALMSSTPIVTLAKGCEASTGQTMAEVMDTLIPEQPHGVLGGPMISEVLNHGHRGVGVIGTTDDQTAAIVTAIFDSTVLTIRHSADISGVSLSGCLKNIYAFAVGISVGLGWNQDRQQRFLGRAKSELLDCGQRLGIQPETINGPAGLDDFMETATSPSSYNRQIGVDLGHDGHLTRSGEATITLPSIVKRLDQPQQFPILSSLPPIIANQQPPSSLQHILDSLTTTVL